MFRPVSSQLNLPQIEEKILGWWQKNKIFERSVENRQGCPRFTLYEGPPTANGSPGIHHVLSRIFKDIIPRYKAMKGYYTPRIAGWDTHGLPVELEVERELGFSGKTQIEEYGIAKFNARCRESVFRYLKEWEAMTERIAFWVDMEHPYVTMENNYIESAWWAIKQMWDKGLVYQGYKVTPHC
ncbi:MAG: isoleucine--tRNA ligase, partial [Dehalococcoidia bacterium]